MYRCCDCGCEYETKPDFCDCGNDTFEEIIPEPEIVPEQKVKHKKTFDEQYPELSKFKESLDPISVIIFLLCIVLSVCSFIFIKPKETQTVQNQEPEVKEERKVADINTFWNDTPPKPEPKANKQEPSVAETIVEQINNIIPKKEETKKQEQKPTVKAPQQKPTQVQQKPAQKTQTKVTQTAKKPAQTQTQTSKPAPSKQTQIQQPKTQTQPQPQNNTQTQTQPKTQQPQPSQQIQTQIRPINTQTSQQQAEKELKAYKSELRNIFASKIKGNLLQVYGDGDCVVAFKISSNGKLASGSFSKQSTNNTLNDAVYQAVMSISSYKIPPSSYNGQTLYLSVKISNGVAQISVY